MRRISVNLIFEQNIEADEVWQALVTYLKNKQIRNIAGEHSFIEYQDCHHDESPPRPCSVLARFEK